MNLIVLIITLIISTTIRFSFGLKVLCRLYSQHENSCASEIFEVPPLDERRVEFNLTYANADNITYVHLYTRNKIGFSSFPEGIFDFFRNVETVFIKLKIERLSKDDWKNAKQLKSLDLQRNEITIIPRDVFTGLDKLQILNFRMNNIHTIEPGAFDSVKNLQHLKLTFNRITNIQRGTFVGLDKLRVVEFNFNQIHTIEDGAFDVPDLRILDFSNNALTTLSNSIFSKMPNLEQFYIRENELIHIDPSMFSLQNLTSINLYKNHIENIDLTDFAKLRRLRDLNLKSSLGSSGFSFNSTKHVGINKSPVEDNMSVRHLDISSNGLTNVKDLFDQLSVFKGLAYLNIGENRFTTYDSVNAGDIKTALPRLIEIIVDGVSAKCESINIFRNQMKDLNVTVKLADKSCPLF